MKTASKFFFCSLLMLCLFQSCSGFAPNKVFSFYSYTEAPEIFHDLKLVRVEVDGYGRQNFLFDLVMSYAADSNQALTYQLSFSSLDVVGVCRTVEGQALGTEKHRQIQCLTATPNDLYVQLLILGPSGEEGKEQYRF